jgi:membrane protein implicated in regulation of membrane protease activity
MNEFEIWVYRGLITALIIVLYYLFQRWIRRIDQRFDELIKAVQKQNEQAIRQSGEILNLTKRVDTCCKRLDDHSKRIRMIEMNQVKS